MLYVPTAGDALFMSALATFTEDLSPKKCQRFRSRMRSRLAGETDKVRFIRDSVPEVKAAQEGAMLLLRVSCGLCPRRVGCSQPLA